MRGGAALGTTAFTLPECSPSQTSQKPPVTAEGQMPSQDFQIMESFKGWAPQQQRSEMRAYTQKLDELGTKYLYSKTPDDAKIIYEELTEALKGKAILLQLYPRTFTGNPGSRVAVEPSKKVVAIDNERYDLNKPSDFIMASALVNAYPRFHVQRLTDDVNTLHKKVSLELFGSPVGNLESLSRVSQILQVFEGKDKPIPQKVRYPATPLYLGDRPLTADQQLRGLNKDVYYTTSGQLADFYFRSDKGPFAQYKKWVEEELNNQINPPMTRPDLAAATGEFLPRTDEADFKTAFTEYFTDGVSLRKRIHYTYARGFTTENRILSAKYEALRSWFGAEIQANGVIKDREEYGIGEAIWIDDYVARENYELGGIFLRPEPTLHTDPRMKVLIQGANVRIVDGPVTLVDDKKEEAMNMWKVENGDFIFDNKAFVPWGNGWEGWISEEWLSKKPVVGRR